MQKNELVKTAKEFDRQLDNGEGIQDLMAKIDRHGKKVRITLDVAEEMVKEIDQIRHSIGVDRGALIKVWLHERLQQERAASAKL